MFKATKSFRFIVVLIAIFAVSTVAIAANWSGARAFGFFESSDAATSVAPEAAPAPLSPQTVVLSDGFEGATTFLFANTAATNLWAIGVLEAWINEIPHEIESAASTVSDGAADRQTPA